MVNRRAHACKVNRWDKLPHLLVNRRAHACKDGKVERNSSELVSYRVRACEEKGTPGIPGIKVSRRTRAWEVMVLNAGIPVVFSHRAHDCEAVNPALVNVH